MPAVAGSSRVSSSQQRDAETLSHILGHIKRGYVRIEDSSGQLHAFGDPKTQPVATIKVHHPDFFSRILRESSLGLGESYMDGWWDAVGGDLMHAAGVLFLNAADMANVIHENPLLILKSLTHYAIHRPNTGKRSRKNVQHHYDLGNDFFRIMLGPTMTYSCGVLDDRHALTSQFNSIDAMQERKLDLVCRKLGLKPGETLVDIGCGWGGLLLHAAKHYGVHATGITLSSEQEAYIKERIQREKITTVDVQCIDYREMEGEFDAFASIGMFEHVGHSQYSTFMEKAGSLLKPQGRGLLHTIGLQKKAMSFVQDPWINTYIFPGGEIPSLEQIIDGMEMEGFLVGHVENFKLHYAETLRHWKNNVDLHRTHIENISGFDERFFRMWDYYLQSCEAGFRYGTLQLYQVLFAKGNDWVFPLRFRFD